MPFHGQDSRAGTRVELTLVAMEMESRNLYFSSAADFCGASNVLTLCMVSTVNIRQYFWRYTIVRIVRPTKPSQSARYTSAREQSTQVSIRPPSIASVGGRQAFHPATCRVLRFIRISLGMEE